MRLPTWLYRWNPPVKRWLLVALLTASAIFPGSVWTRHLGQTDSPRLDEVELLYSPTPPVPLKRMIDESGSTDALVVALPETQVLGNPRKEAFFLRLIEIAAKYVKVVILVDREDSLAPLNVTQWIQGRVRNPSAVLSQVTFVRSLLDTEWVRDYGPLFGLSMRNEIVLLDNMCRDPRSEARTERMLAGLGFVRTDMPLAGGPHGRDNRYLSDYGVFWRRNDDAAPLYFNEFLYTERHKYSPLVRPPLVLAGGDVAFAENGRMFTSTRTLEMNGGDDRRFSRLAKEYFAAGEVAYLRPLPNSIWHIDMFFRMARPGVAMLGEFVDTAAPAESAYLRLLRREAAATLEWNRALIAERLPGVEVIRVPMPRILMPTNAPTAGPGLTGIPELDSAVRPSGATVKTQLTVVYRSFLNSVFLNGGPSRSAVLVPGFAGLEAMEGGVAAAYRRAYPGAEVYFIPADVLSEDFGGIHCVTVTIPAAPPGAEIRR